MEEYIKTLKSLSEQTRIRILALLHQAREACVSDIVDALEESQYKVSRHLKILQDAGMVKGSKKGRWIYYQLDENQVRFQKMLLEAVKDISSDIINNDLERLQKRLGKDLNDLCINNKAESYQESYQEQ